MSEKKKIDGNTDNSVENEVSSEITSEKEEKETKPSLPPHKAYAKRVLQFESYYRQLIIILGVIIAVAIAIAVVYNVLIGLSAAIVASVIYAVFVSDEMFKRLGLNYKSVSGGIKITSCRARYGDVIWIPAKLMGFDVIRIDDRAFDSTKNDSLTCVFFPSSIKEIGEDIFAGCNAITEIHFEGTEEEWKKIKKDTDLDSLTVRFGAKYPPIPKKKKKQSKAKKAPKKANK